MITFTTYPTPPSSPSYFAVGWNTGSLFLMIKPNVGRVIIGRGILSGREGQLHRANEEYFKRLPHGTTISIQV